MYTYLTTAHATFSSNVIEILSGDGLYSYK